MENRPKQDKNATLGKGLQRRREKTGKLKVGIDIPLKRGEIIGWRETATRQ